MFSPDQLVVYPAQGVGIVERVETKEIVGSKADFYIVRILDNNVTLMVPVKNAKNVGLRHLSSLDECEKIMNNLKDRRGFARYTGQNWNRRYREYMEKLQSGAMKDVCHVLKELMLISGEKELSFGERRLLEQAMNLITMEIACVTDSQQEIVQKEVEQLFSDILEKAEKDL